ncbi:MAG: hypothetical protein H0W10_06755 [Chloroflexi bacterium]|nr:hypothetical protein [Chloroflexota bacterium]
MKALLLLVLVVVVVGGGLKLAGARLPLIDYPIGPMGIDTPGPAMPDIQIEPPGFDDFGAP